MASMDGNGPAEALYAVAELQKKVGRTEASLVRKARQAGLSWEAIALCLGGSKQAVHRKYGKQETSPTSELASRCPVLKAVNVSGSGCCLRMWQGSIVRVRQFGLPVPRDGRCPDTCKSRRRCIRVRILRSPFAG